MAASDIAFGEDYPGTRTEQPPPTTRRAQLSDIAFPQGENPKVGYTVSTELDTPALHDHGPDS